MSSWTVDHVAPNVHVVNVQMDGGSDTFEVFLSSDWHWDHPDCDRKLLAQHLNEAKAADAPVLCVGDALCAMQSQHDKRRTKGRTRPEHDAPDYFTRLTEDFAEWLDPWKDNLAVLSDGNHEAAVTRNSGIDLLHHVVGALKVRGAPHVGKGGYAGFVRFRFQRNNHRQSIRMFYHHGSGGSAPATRGTLKINRRIAMAHAELMVEGHDHNRFYVPEVYEKLNDANVITPVNTFHLRLGSYKSSGGIRSSGWEVEKGMGKRPLGGYFVTFWLSDWRERHVQYGVRDPGIPRQVAAA